MTKRCVRCKRPIFQFYANLCDQCLKMMKFENRQAAIQEIADRQEAFAARRRGGRASCEPVY